MKRFPSAGQARLENGGGSAFSRNSASANR